MTPEQAAHETAKAIGDIPSKFMVDMATYGRGAELGFNGLDFYIAGRGGVLGDVDADIVTAAFVFFTPHVVREGWERSAAVMPRAEAAVAWANVGYEWARANLAGDDRAAELLGRIVTAAPVPLAPLFAGWRQLPEPSDGPALLLHRLNALRELRMALHAAAVLTVGLAPIDAVAVKSPMMAPVYGWTDLPDAGPLQERWSLAEARTDRMLGRHYGVLDDDERSELVALLRSIAA